MILKNVHSTKDEIIRCAIRLMQERGYTNLGLRDLALEIGIKAPSFYHHFKSKSELAKIALYTYREQQLKKLNEIDREICLTNRLRAYTALFGDMLIDEGYVCFAMILAFEKKRAEQEVQQEIDAFYNQNIKWLEKTWKEGTTTGQISSQVPPKQVAKIIFGAFEGMMAFATGEDRNQKKQFVRNALTLLKQLGANL